MPDFKKKRSKSAASAADVSDSSGLMDRPRWSPDREEESSLSSFVERPVPTEREVIHFERVVKREAREQEIDSNLSEVYMNKKGQPADVKKMKVKKRSSFLVRLFRKFLWLAIMAIGVYLAYSYIFGGDNDVSALNFKINAPEKITAGEEFSYRIEYHNPTKYILSRLRLELQYPENFVFMAASVAPASGNYGWDLSDLEPGGTEVITITGRLISRPDSVNVISGRLSYLPGSFTSQFTKEASASTLISGLGFAVDLIYSNTAFLNQDNEMILVFSNVTNNYLGDFNISFSVPVEANASVVTDKTAEPAANATTTVTGTEIIPTSDTTAKTGTSVENETTIENETAIETGTTIKTGMETVTIAEAFLPGEVKKFLITKSGGASWQVSGLNEESGRQEVPLTYRVTKRSDNLEIKVRLEKKLPDGQAYTFWEKAIKPELVDSDLNLTLLLNGSKNDGALNFGQTLNYSLSYANRGANTFKDVVIMAAVSGDFLDWNSLRDEKGGQTQNRSVIWTKNEMPELAEIKPGQEGAIDFSFNLLPFKDSDQGRSLVVTAYGQYGVNNSPVKGESNKSNFITSRINSDLSLSEEIRYFNEDNVPVGSGPLPPQVGQRTGFKVFWTVKNNLHELTDTRAAFTLPSYVVWGEGSTNVGSLFYDQATRQVIWEIGRLPVSVYRADAEFNISITPTDADRDKILVLSPGSVVSATDTETKDTIIFKTDPRTTKLEDDDIAGLNNSGVVR